MAGMEKHLLLRAEELMGPGEYDPLLLLALAMDDSVLRLHTCFGERLLQLLEPLLSEAAGNRDILLREARMMVASHNGWFCVEMLRRVVGMTKEPMAAVQSKKNKLFEGFLEEAGAKQRRRMAYPSLLQVVYKSGARRHFLADRWVDALQIEMQEMVLRSRDSEQEQWMGDAARVVLFVDFKKQMMSSGRKGMRTGGAPLQVIEFPNFLQRTHKLYVDWDKTLSDVESGSDFLGRSGGTCDVVQRRANVQRIRQLALGTPAAIIRLLRRIGCSFTGAATPGAIKVLVKEGTRKLATSSSSGCGGGEDWKISFHFVFQVLLSSTQFRLLYHRMAEAIQKDNRDLAVALKLADEEDEALRVCRVSGAMQDAEYGALVGMDMHPRQNVYQGLACMGSRKTEDCPRNHYVGCMVVDEGGASSRWLPGGDNKEEVCQSQGDTNDSTASTVVDGREASSSSSSSRDMLLGKFNKLLQLWMEASVVLPSASCTGVRIDMDDCLPSAGSDGHDDDDDADFPLSRALKLLKQLDAMTSRICRGAGLGGSGSPQQLLLLQAPIQHSSGGAATAAKKTDGELWKKLVYQSSGLQWFRDALGGEEATRRLFQNAYMNIQSISKPSELSRALQDAASVAAAAAVKQTAGEGRKKCPPWAIVHLAESEACICCAAVMAVPFKGFKRHRRNGVVFCFFGGKVFVTCMDTECRLLLARRCKAFFTLARELEHIHLGAYDEVMPPRKEDFFDSICCRSPFVASSSCCCLSADQDLIRREAEKRWARVMKQGGTNVGWTEQQACRLQQGKMVFATAEADEASRCDLQKIRKVPSSHMCNSASEERVWIELRGDTLREFLQCTRQEVAGTKKLLLLPRTKMTQQLLFTERRVPTMKQAAAAAASAAAAGRQRGGSAKRARNR